MLSTVASSPSDAASSSSRSPKLCHYLLTDKPWQARNAARDTEAAGRDRVIQRVELAVEAEQLGQPTEVKQVPMPKPSNWSATAANSLVVFDQIIVDQRRLVGRDPTIVSSSRISISRPSVPSSTM